MYHTELFICCKYCRKTPCKHPTSLMLYFSIAMHINVLLIHNWLWLWNITENFIYFRVPMLMCTVQCGLPMAVPLWPYRAGLSALHRSFQPSSMASMASTWLWALTWYSLKFLQHSYSWSELNIVHDFPAVYWIINDNTINHSLCQWCVHMIMHLADWVLYVFMLCFFLYEYLRGYETFWIF